MTRHNEDYYVNYPISVVSAALPHLTMEEDWKLVHGSDVQLVLEEDLHKPAMFAGVFPVQVEIRLAIKSPASTRVLIKGSNSGMGPIQKKHVQKRVSDIKMMIDEVCNSIMAASEQQEVAKLVSGRPVYCTQCGTKLDEAARFCRQCGQRVA
ncbi:MAG: zinc ribbon domain-containing protein [Anaerolineae bacterium]|nr:zinc ribbon domain-containing protein [Anaerolineae bacterium]